jgi:hypothetical protein
MLYTITHRVGDTQKHMVDRQAGGIADGSRQVRQRVETGGTPSREIN